MNEEMVIMLKIAWHILVNTEQPKVARPGGAHLPERGGGVCPTFCHRHIASECRQGDSKASNDALFTVHHVSDRQRVAIAALAGLHAAELC